MGPQVSGRGVLFGRNDKRIFKNETYTKTDYSCDEIE